MYSKSDRAIERVKDQLETMVVNRYNTIHFPTSNIKEAKALVYLLRQAITIAHKQNIGRYNKLRYRYKLTEKQDGVYAAPRYGHKGARVVRELTKEFPDVIDFNGCLVELSNEDNLTVDKLIFPSYVPTTLEVALLLKWTSKNNYIVEYQTLPLYFKKNDKTPTTND